VLVTATMVCSRGDQLIRQDLLSRLEREAGVLPDEMGVMVHDGTVSLLGQVDSLDKKETIHEIAHASHGVRAVANELEILYPTPTELSDQELTSAVKRALEREAMFPMERLTVSTRDGVVTLRGAVSCHYQQAAAERLLRRLPGVKRLVDLIDVHPVAAD
jgi:osmotically-inducible protein OsmY